MKKLPKSTRKYIRKEKARLKREFFDFKKREEKINELYAKFGVKTELVKKEKEEYSKDNEKQGYIQKSK